MNENLEKQIIEEERFGEFNTYSCRRECDTAPIYFASAYVLDGHIILHADFGRGGVSRVSKKQVMPIGIEEDSKEGRAKSDERTYKWVLSLAKDSAEKGFSEFEDRTHFASVRTQ